MNKKYYISLLLSLITAFVIGAVIILAMGFNPIEGYAQLFKGAFMGNFNIGGTLQMFVPLMLTALAFAIASKVGIFNIGVEGEFYLGAIAAAWVGASLSGLPSFLHITICLVVAAIVGSMWAFIPGYLKSYFDVNEVTTTILLNYVAIYMTTYLVNGRLSAQSGVAKTKDIAKSAKLSLILKPSKANSGLFISILILIFIYWITFHTTLGYRLRAVGINKKFAEYIGIKDKRMMVIGMMISGAIGGAAGGIEVMGVYGYFLGNFSVGIAFDGMLISLIAKNNIKLLPFISLFIASLKAGALGMERFTGIPKSLIDIIIAIFILLVAMEGLYSNLKRKKEAVSV
ncbi:ABC transporter permease [Clostridium algidicarnis]|uniref:ABC transporter permease n=1 Tax=Clostridium algidicarnis TaxID=37659 RepID=UPI003FD8F574